MNKPIFLLAMVAAVLAIGVTTTQFNAATANRAADPPQQPTAHFEDLA